MPPRLNSVEFALAAEGSRSERVVVGPTKIREILQNYRTTHTYFIRVKKWP